MTASTTSHGRGEVPKDSTHGAEPSIAVHHFAPEPGQLVEVRRRQWIVSDVHAAAVAEGLPRHHLVKLASIDEDALGEELQVICMGAAPRPPGTPGCADPVAAYGETLRDGPQTAP